MAMTTVEKDAFSDEAWKALDHPLVESAVDELCFNLKIPNAGLPRHGIRKIAMYAAVVARAHALGIDPDELRMTNDESDEVQLGLVQAAAEAKQPVIIITP